MVDRCTISKLWVHLFYQQEKIKHPFLIFISALYQIELNRLQKLVLATMGIENRH